MYDVSCLISLILPKIKSISNNDLGIKLEQENRAFDSTQMDGTAISALIEKIGRGDQSALMTLYDSTSNLIFGLVLRALEDPAAAEEVLLDIYTHVWKQAGSFDPKLFQPLEWLILTARVRAMARLHLDKQSRKRTALSVGDFDSAITVSPELQNLARSSIASLSAAQREVLDWAFYSGLSSAEIAVQIGKPLGAVKIHSRLGMNKLSELFRPLFEHQA